MSDETTAPPRAPAPGRPGWPGRLGPPALVVAAAVAAYANSFDVPLQFDDLPNIVNAPSVHALDLSPASLAPSVEGFPANRWLSRLSFAVDHALHGLQPFGYHLVNLVAHLAASLLVLALARAVLARLEVARPDAAWRVGAAAAGRVALVTALLFAVHPVHTQAVTYVVQRMTSLGAAFALASLWLWLRARRPGTRPGPWLAGATACAFLAFSAKETAAVLPLLVLVLEVVLFPGLGARVRAHWRPVAAAGAAVGLAGALVLWKVAGLIASESVRLGIPLDERLLSQGRILVHYLTLLAFPWPGRLHVDYAWPASRSLLDPWTTLPALLAVAALAWAAVRWRARAPLLALAVLWFLAALAMEQTVLPIDLVYEHRLYLPSFGLLLLAAAALEQAGEAVWPGRPVGALAAGLPLAALLAAGTAARNADWADPTRLYDDAAGHAPGAARHLLTLSAELWAKGRYDEAEATLRQVIALEPGNVAARVNLGNVHLRRGDRLAAERAYREGIAMDPGAGAVWYALGCLLLETGRAAEAVPAFERAAAANAADAAARTNLAIARASLGDRAGALAAIDDALRADPGHAMAWLNRAEFRLFGGRDAEALADARQAERLMPRDARPLVVAGESLLRLGRRDEALAAFRAAAAYDPASARARAGLQALGGR